VCSLSSTFAGGFGSGSPSATICAPGCTGMTISVAFTGAELGMGILRQRLADEVGVLGRKVGMGKQQMFVQVKQSTQRHLANVNI